MPLRTDRSVQRNGMRGGPSVRTRSTAERNRTCSECSEPDPLPGIGANGYDACLARADRRVQRSDPESPQGAGFP